MRRFYKIYFMIFSILLLAAFSEKAEAASDRENIYNKMVIHLEGTSIDTINNGSKETRYSGNALTVNGAYYENIEMKGRGNSTWTYPKKPYQIKFSSNVDLFGLGQSKTWILLANYYDLANLRTDTSFRLAAALKLGFDNKGSWVNLYVDDRYMGLYYLCHKNRIGKNEVNIRQDGAVLVEMENLIHMSPDDYYEFTKYYNKAIAVKDSIGDEKTNLHRFIEDYSMLEYYANQQDYEGVCKVCDVESFASYYLVQEFAQSIDGWDKGIYMYQDGANDKIHAGPVWDYDLAYASDENSLFSHNTDYNRKDASVAYWQKSTVYKKLIEIPEFRQLVCKIYKDTFHDTLAGLVSYEEENFARIQSSVAMDLQANPRPFQGDIQKDKHISYMVDRLDYMDLLYLPEYPLEDGCYEIAGKCYDYKNEMAGTPNQYLVTYDDNHYYLFQGNKRVLIATADTVKAHQHKYTETTVKGSWKKEGYAQSKCNVCGYSKKGIIYPAITEVIVSNLAYKGKKQYPSVILKDSAGKIVDKSNYCLQSVNAGGGIGRQTGIIHLQGNYQGSISISYKVLPAKVSLKKRRGNVLYASQSKSKVDGYQFQLSNNQKMQKAKRYYSRNVRKRFNSRLLKNKTYVRVRCYKKVKGIVYYSKWSKVYKVKSPTSHD